MKITRLRALGALGLAAAAGSLAISSPAQAATNPYTPQSACHHDFGGSWHTVSDGHRILIDRYGNTWGNVYLEYNSATGYNCVATIKSYWVGQPTGLTAYLIVQGAASDSADIGEYKYYAATQQKAAGKCVQYFGEIWTPDGDSSVINGRWSKGNPQWGNCG
ncbi:Uncharacterised protein [Mycobacterium tuberculosis]|nr:Uncharacterised protein [Mycobacterium tuberculosis]